ncbi:MAG: phosphate ABC transporter permease PstA [Phycisphaerae bacterium]|nr:phosphate ABC transporter permease PstA [Gemmatimonadaceae bacterium]
MAGVARAAFRSTRVNNTALARRRRSSAVMTGFIYVGGALAMLPLIAILAHITARGLSAFSIAFFTQLPAPAGADGGGIGNAITGTLMLIGMASAIGLPVGIGAGLFLADRRTTRLAHTVRFLADVLNGLPSVVLGVFAWELLVRPVGHFSALSGGITLGMLMIPLVTRATEEMVKLVPVALSEAALALGFSQWRTVAKVVLRTALPGIVTGALVAMARVAGETAPLLFTAFGSPYWVWDVRRPIAALPLQVYSFAQSPYDEWRAQAWAGALVLIAIVAVISASARLAIRSRQRLARGASAGRSIRA